MKEKQYLEGLVESKLSEMPVFHRKRLLQKQIQILTAKKAKKCPNSKDPQVCAAKFDTRIDTKKETLKKLDKKFHINIGIGTKK